MLSFAAAQHNTNSSHRVRFALFYEVQGPAGQETSRSWPHTSFLTRSFRLSYDSHALTCHSREHANEHSQNTLKCLHQKNIYYSYMTRTDQTHLISSKRRPSVGRRRTRTKKRHNTFPCSLVVCSQELHVVPWA